MKLPLKYSPQREGHTCGLCAARVVYDHFDVSTQHLRRDLKVDSPAIPWKQDSKGILPPTLLSVLRKDGFMVEIFPVNRHSMAAICRHLDLANPTIALQGDCIDDLHWVVIGGFSPKFLHIMDSLGGWRRIGKKNALKQFRSFITIRGWDGESRKTSMLDMMKSWPEPRHFRELLRNQFS